MTASEELLFLQKQHTLLLEDQRAGQQLQQLIRPSTPWETQGITFEHCVVPALYLTGDSLDYPARWPSVLILGGCVWTRHGIRADQHAG